MPGMMWHNVVICKLHYSTSPSLHIFQQSIKHQFHTLEEAILPLGSTIPSEMHLAPPYKLLVNTAYTANTGYTAVTAYNAYTVYIACTQWHIYVYLYWNLETQSKHWGVIWSRTLQEQCDGTGWIIPGMHGAAFFWIGAKEKKSGWGGAGQGGEQNPRGGARTVEPYQGIFRVGQKDHKPISWARVSVFFQQMWTFLSFFFCLFFIHHLVHFLSGSTDHFHF